MPFGRLVLPALLLSTPLLSQAVDPARTGLPEKSAGVVSYRIAVRLSRGEAESPQSLASPADSDPGVPLRYLNGRARIRYRNITEGSSSELRFHLYLNAFRNLRSTHLRESERLQKSYGSGRDEWGNKDEFGWIRVDELELVSGAGGPAEKLRQEFISPDDGNPDDRTVLKAALPGAFEPGSEILLELRFTAKLPKAYRRTGWGPGNFFMVAQWFPKLGVLEDGEDGRSTWNCHQFHASTEFYADYGSYDVKIETPAGWPVGATGELRGEVEQLIDGYERRLFYQDDVHDFAWVTDKDYKVDEWTFEGRDKQEPRIAEILETKFGYPGEQLRLSDVKVRMLLHPEHATEAHIARHRRAVEVALSFFGSRYGRYPYKTLTVVDPCRDLEWRNLGGGMEYPTLITCGTPPILHSRALRPEGVTIHEFGHQFWYGLSGNNEFEHSWLDEGFNSYSEGRAQDLAYNKLEGNPPVGDPAHVSTFGIIPFRGRSTGSLDGLGSGAVKELTTLRRLDLEPLLELTGAKEIKALLESINFEGEILPDLGALEIIRSLPFFTYERDVPHRNLYSDRARCLEAPHTDPIVRNAWEYLDRSSYRSNSYSRPSTVLSTLERMMGYERWWAFARRFHEQARFAHPTSQDFLRLLEEHTTDMPEVLSFARDAFFTTKSLDYGIEVRQVEEPEAKGYFEDAEEEKGQGDVTEVTVHRKGEIVVPVDLLFVFEKKGLVRERWAAEGQGNWKRYVFSAVQIREYGKLREAYVDPPDPDRFEPYVGPAGVYVVDSNLLNNSWQAKINKLPARHHSLRSFLWVQTVLSFFGGLG